MKRLICPIGIVALTALSCSPPPSATVRLPSGAEAPARTDSSFVALLDDLIASGNSDHRVLCYLQYEKSEMPPVREDMEPLQNLGEDIWVIWATAGAIEEYLAHPNLRFINEYLPEYKYNRTLAGVDVAWIYVEVFTDPSPEMSDEMAELGIESVRYYSIEKRYYGKATGRQIVQLAESWWVKKIYRARTWIYN